jgi:hypothetical protein
MPNGILLICASLTLDFGGAFLGLHASLMIFSKLDILVVVNPGLLTVFGQGG